MGMMDVRPKGLLRRDDQHVVEDELQKCCVHCKTTKTPLWRGGPAGPKSLCNACGIRFRKRRISSGMKGERSLNIGSTAVPATISSSGTMGTTTTGSGGEEDLGECGSLRMKLMMALGDKTVVMKNLPLAIKKQCQRPSKLREEEQAAVSLMALSCGSVFS